MKNQKILLAALSAMMVAATPAFLPAQTSQSTDASTAPKEKDKEVVTMSQFEVTTTQGHGYSAPTSAAAFKTNEEMINIPQGVVVVTTDFINDLNQANTSDILRYFGVAAKFFGDTMLMRGSNIQVQPWVDDIPVKGFFSDSAMFDSYEVIKGPAQALYLGAGIGGLVLETTKKPLPFNQNIVTASLDEWGLYRFTFDSTGPLGKLGDAEIGYRLVGAYQDGNQYFTDGKNKRSMIFPEFSVKYHDTSIRIYFEMLDTITQQGMAFITPQGDLYTGNNWRTADNRTPGYAPDWATSNLYGEALQKISDSWETKICGGYYKQHVYGKYFSPTLANFDTDQGTWIDRVANERWDYWTALVDAQGHYAIGPSNWEMASRDNFGFNFSNWTDKQAYWQTAPFPYPNGPIGGKYVIPFGQTDGTVLAPTSAFPPPSSGTLGVYNTVTQDAIYWQHELDVVPNWLTLTACFTWANIDTEAVPNWGTVPYASTHTPGQQWVHRLGAVFHATKAVSVYALESTNFSTPLGTLLQNGQLAPNQVGKGDEVGLKWNFFGGKLSGEIASYKVTTTNSLNTAAGLLPNGLNYAAVIGSTVLKGVDGDFSWEIMPGWQLIGAFYQGHMRDAFNNPVNGSWENSLGLYTRYDFSKGSPLQGLAIGGGMNKIGSRWISTSNGSEIYSGPGGVPANIKIKDGTEVQGFVEYTLNRHWTLAVNCTNILNKAYVLNYQLPLFADASPPRTFTFETTFKY